MRGTYEKNVLFLWSRAGLAHPADRVCVLNFFRRYSSGPRAGSNRAADCCYRRGSAERLRRAACVLRRRFSNTTQAYVLPPWAFFFGELFEGQGFRHGPPDYLFTQEIEMGLPYRFGVAAEAQFERFNGDGGARSVSLEARWALADWYN